MADFETDISEWCDQAGDGLDQFVRAFALNMTTAIKEGTPVMTGRLRSSIQPSEDLASWTAGEPIVIGTNVEYARRIEYGFVGVDALGRHYDQKGVGMFSSAVTHADEIAAETLKNIKEGGSGVASGVASNAGVGAAEEVGTRSLEQVLSKEVESAAAGATHAVITAETLVKGAVSGVVIGTVEDAVNEKAFGKMSSAEGGVVGAAEGAAIGAVLGGPAGAISGAAIEGALGVLNGSNKDK